MNIRNMDYHEFIIERYDNIERGFDPENDPYQFGKNSKTSITFLAIVPFFLDPLTRKPVSS